MFPLLNKSLLIQRIQRRDRLREINSHSVPRTQLRLPISQTLPFISINQELESRLEAMKDINGILDINGISYQTNIDDLEYIEELGRGTGGYVVKMKHKPSGVDIAVKKIRRSANAEESRQLMMDLNVMLKSRDCPYIVKCLGCFITKTDVWICMELMMTCLDMFLQKTQRPMSEDLIGKVTVATIKALSYLEEEHGVIHRDVKPANILISKSGNVKLCDFGVSGILVNNKAKTRTAGCMAYMAPERIVPPDSSKPDYDIRADVWSLGITLLELATGVFPYHESDSYFEVLSRIVQDDPPKLPRDKYFSVDFSNFIDQCLTKNYTSRPNYRQLMQHPFVQKYDMSCSLKLDNLQFHQIAPSERLDNRKRKSNGFQKSQTVCMEKGYVARFCSKCLSAKEKYQQKLQKNSSVPSGAEVYEFNNTNNGCSFGKYFRRSWNYLKRSCYNFSNKVNCCGITLLAENIKTYS